MNKVILMGRLTKDPDVRYAQNGNNTNCVARYTLAVDRKFKRDGDASADFINCVAFGKSGEFTERYFKKGTKIALVGRIQTGSYINREGQKVSTTDVVVEEQEFAESKNASQGNAPTGGNMPIGNMGMPQPETPPPANIPSAPKGMDGFMTIPDGVEEELPFL